MKFVAFLSVSLLSFSVLADQCSFVSKDVAKAAAIEILKAKKIEARCDACGEMSYKKITLNSLSVEPANFQEFYQVKINGKNIDLAYIFVDRKNLGLKTLCL